MDVAQVIQWFQEGDMVKTQEGCQTLLQQSGADQGLLCYILGICLVRQGHANLAEAWLQRAVQAEPDNGRFQSALGNWLELAERLTEAAACYQRALLLDPSWSETWWRLGRVLTLLQRPEEGITTLYGLLEREPHHVASHLWLAKTFLEQDRELEASVHLCIYNHLTTGQTVAQENEPVDSLFLDGDRARQTAELQNTVAAERIRCGFPGTQLCYTLGSSRAGDPPSLVVVPPDGLDAFFYASRLRAPVRVVFDPADVAQCRRSWQVAHLIHTVGQNKREIGLAQLLPYTRRSLTAQGPLRVLLLSSRADLDSRFFAEGLASALGGLGCEARALYEDLTRERYDVLDWVELFQKFHPHVVVSISQHLNYWFHPQTVNVIWWQDPVGQLCRGVPLQWRPRDINFSFSRELDPYLLRVGAAAGSILRQGFVADQAIFHRMAGVTRQRKVVFVGSSYANKGIIAEAMATPAGARVLEILTGLMEGGQPFSRELSARLARESGIPEHAIFWYFLHYVVRDQSVRWLCRVADLLPVEVYGGPLWADDPLVRPYYRGHLPRGEAVARLYNESLYTLVSHPFDLHSERLMEVAACGSIPVVFDCRPWAELPHWDDHCLWFRTYEALRRCFDQRPLADPMAICREADMTGFARRILREVAARQFWPVAEMLGRQL